MTGDMSVTETRQAGPGDGSCQACGEDLAAGQRIAYVRGPDGHGWVHVRCLLTASTGAGQAQA